MAKRDLPPKKLAASPKAGARTTALAASRARRGLVDSGSARFAEVIALIEAARQRAYLAVNTELVAHY